MTPQDQPRDKFLNISPLKMSGNVDCAAAIDTDPGIFSNTLVYYRFLEED